MQITAPMQIAPGKGPEIADSAARATVDEAEKSGSIQEYVRSSTNSAVLNASMKVSINSGYKSA